ncbi:hypothetical protein ABBQ32_008440 [Trebouxia sp. C0010 RCD-2024]
MSRALAGISRRRLPLHADIWNKGTPQRLFKQFVHQRQSLGLTNLPYDHKLSGSKARLRRNWHLHPSVHTTLAQLSTAQSSIAAGCVAPSGLLLPLNERPIQAEVSLQDLFAWHLTAEAQAKAVGAAFVEEDDGPSAEDLLIELNWLLDDAVAAQSSSAFVWKACSWRHLQSVNSSSTRVPGTPRHDDTRVALRLSLTSLTDLWKQRTQGRVPLQYLNNCCHWRDMVLAVGPGVLIPRPETELLIDFAQQALQKNPALGTGPWLDLGTGSGAIALGLASILPKAAQVYAVDSSSAALAWAQLNVDRLNLAGRVMKEVGQFEPWLALDGGQGLGLDSLTPICSGAAEQLQAGGFLALETTGTAGINLP